MTPPGPWIVLGQCVTGTSHRTRNNPCQDALRHQAFGPTAEWLVVAVADGAGSAARSEIGATLACEEFVSQVQNCPVERLLSREAIFEIIAHVRGRIQAEAERLETTPRELACTVLLAVVGPTAAAFAQLGDGAVVFKCGDAYRTVFWPEPSEYANATDFLTDDHYRDRVRFEVVNEPITELALITDGLQRLALDFANRQPHAAFFRPFFDRLRAEPTPEVLAEPLAAFLDSDRINGRTDDDKTLVLALRQP